MSYHVFWPASTYTLPTRIRVPENFESSSASCGLSGPNSPRLRHPHQTITQENHQTALLQMICPVRVLSCKNCLPLRCIFLVGVVARTVHTSTQRGERESRDMTYAAATSKEQSARETWAETVSPDTAGTTSRLSKRDLNLACLPPPHSRLASFSLLALRREGQGQVRTA